MQIGTGSNHLPGCAPAPAGSLPAGLPPPPVVPVPLTRRPTKHDRRVTIVLVCLLLLTIAVVGVHLYFGRDMKATGGLAVLDSAKQFVVRLTAPQPGREGTATNSSLHLTPGQQRIVAEYSPARQIQEAKRAKELARARAAGQVEDGASNAAPSAPAVPAPASASVLEPGPHAAAGKLTASRPDAEKSFPIWPDARISGIIGSPQSRWVARINGHLVSVGDTFDGVKVTAIATQRVTLSYGGQERDFFVGASH